MRSLALATALTLAGLFGASDASAAVVVVRPRARVLVRPARPVVVAPAPVVTYGVRPALIRPAVRPVVRTRIAVRRHRIRYRLHH